jgi:hypothetical protein
MFLKNVGDILAQGPGLKKWEKRIRLKRGEIVHESRVYANHFLLFKVIADYAN